MTDYAWMSHTPALVFVYYINRYYTTNVPIWQGREEGIKMKLWLQLLNTNEDDTYLARWKGGSLFESS